MLVLLVGSSALAQKEFEGLDLTDDKKPEEKKPEPAAPTPAAKPAERKPVTSKEDLPPGERDITAFTLSSKAFPRYGLQDDINKPTQLLGY